MQNRGREAQWRRELGFRYSSPVIIQRSEETSVTLCELTLPWSFLGFGKRKFDTTI
jgi:hypothetical protein